MAGQDAALTDLTFDSSSPEAGPSKAEPSKAGPSNAVSAAVSHPPGPYGLAVGDVFPNLVLEGDLSAPESGDFSSEGVAPFALAELKQLGASFVLLHASRPGCDACARSARSLSAKRAAAEAGGVIIEVLIGGDRSDWELWGRANDLSIPFVRLNGAANVEFPPGESAYVIDLWDMLVSWRGTGASAADEGFAYLVDRLERCGCGGC